MIIWLLWSAVYTILKNTQKKKILKDNLNCDNGSDLLENIIFKMNFNISLIYNPQSNHDLRHQTEEPLISCQRRQMAP